MIVKLKYLSREKSGLYLYFRQIPEDLRHHYEGRVLRRQSLKTHDPAIAATEALKLAQLDDKIWQALKNGTPDIETARAAIADTRTMDMIRRMVKAKVGPRFSAALGLYLKKHEGRGEAFVRKANQVFGIVKDLIGDKPLSEIKRADARLVLDSMLAQNLKTSTIRRYLNTVSAIYSTGLLEFEVDAKNPFAGLTIPNFLKDSKEVPSFSEDELRQIAVAGLAQKNDAGLIATVQVETGARVSEIALLRVEDVHLDAPVPYIDIREHREHGRTLKTSGSVRALPLVGCSLQAVRLAAASAKDSWLFTQISKKNPGSTVVRWLSRTLGGQRGSHSARHSMESRLILARTDQRLIDTVLGHKSPGMGSLYFSGYSLSDLAEAIQRIAIR
jgi:integrase